MNKQDISTLAVIFCAILGMIGTYWLTQYIDQSPRITAPTYNIEEPATLIPEPIKSWPIEAGDKG
jgi:hypothetical protein